MSSRKLRSRIKFLDKEIANCENRVPNLGSSNMKTVKHALQMPVIRNKGKRSAKNIDSRPFTSDGTYSNIVDPMLPNVSGQVKCPALDKYISTNWSNKTTGHKLCGSTGTLRKSRGQTWGDLLKEQSKTVFLTKDIRSKPIKRSSLLPCKQQRGRHVDNESRHNNSTASFSSDVAKCSNEDAKSVGLNKKYTHARHIFAIFDTIRTLRFLVTELQDFAKSYYDDELLWRIISDIEKTLLQLPKDTGNVATTSLDPNKSDNTPLPSTSRFEPIPLKLQESYSMKSHLSKQPNPIPVYISRASSPMEDVKMDFHTESHMKEELHASLEKSIQQKELSIVELQLAKRVLEFDLQAKQRDLVEKNYKIEELTKEAEKKEHDVQALRKKEQDYLKVLSIQRTNIEELHQTLSDIAKNQSNLIEENQICMLWFNLLHHLNHLNLMPAMCSALENDTLCETRDKLSQEINANCDMLKNLNVNLQECIDHNEKLCMQLLVSSNKQMRWQVLDKNHEHNSSRLQRVMLDLRNVVKGEMAKLSNEKTHTALSNVKAVPYPIPASSSRNSSHTPGPEEVSWLNMSSVLLGQPKMLKYLEECEELKLSEQLECVDLPMESTEFEKLILESCTDITSKENDSSATPDMQRSAGTDLGFTIFENNSTIEESVNSSMEVEECNKENESPLQFVNMSVDTTNSIQHLRKSSSPSVFPIHLSGIVQSDEVIRKNVHDQLTTERFYSLASVPSPPRPPSGIVEPGGVSQWSELHSANEGSNKESK